MEGTAEAKQEEAQTPTTLAQTDVAPPTPPTTGKIEGPPPEKTPPPRTSPKPRRKFIILGVIFLLLAGLTGAFATVAYQGVKLPFVSKELSLQLQKAYANLPFVPKASRHVLLQSLDASLEIKTFTIDASASIMGFDLAFYGDAEIKEETASFDFHLTAKSTDPTFPLTLEADLIGLDKDFYFKVGTLTSPLLTSLGIDLTPAIGKWWRTDLGTSGTQAEPTTTLTQEAQQKAIEVFSKPEIIKAVTKEKDEKIGEELCSHLQITPTKEVVIKLIEALQEESLTDEEKKGIEEGFEGIEKLEIDLWIGKNTHIIRKIKILFKIKSTMEGLDPAASLGLPETIEGTFELAIPKINAPVSITAPEGAQDIEELIQLLTDMISGSSLPEVLGEQTKLFLKSVN